MASTLTQVSSNKCFGGLQNVYSHQSEELRCTMKIGVYLPPACVATHGRAEKCPVLIWLSGLTCTEANFIQKAGAQRYAAQHNLIIVNPDTSPRGCNIAGEDDSYDFGSGAGFYIDATEEKWAKHYRMYSYVTKELLKVIDDNFPTIPGKRGIFGHSMGGHGALTLALKNPDLFQSVSAFSPICNPVECPWGKKAFSGYFGEGNKDKWAEHDATVLIRNGKGKEFGEILIDQGKSDDFLGKESEEFKYGQLMPLNLSKACKDNGVNTNVRLQDGYDHSYFFISTFVGDHIDHHAKVLKG